MNTVTEKNYWYYLIAFLCGAGLVLAFAPAHFFMLVFVMPAALLWLLIHSTPKQAIAMGFAFGFGYFIFGISWVFIAIYVFGGTSGWIAAIITFLFAVILALFFALLGYLLQKLFPKNSAVKLLLVYPALWALLEAFRSWFFTGFPWLLIGHTVANSFLTGLAPIFGVYGCSFCLVMVSSLVLLSALPNLLNDENINWKISNRAFLGLILFLIFAFGVKFVHWTTPVERDYSVSLVQGNISQSLRWDPQEVDNILQTYRAMTEGHWQSDLIVWPEAALPVTEEEAKPYLDEVQEQLAKTHAALVTGIPIEENHRYYNAAIGLGEAQGEYLKRHLVPFGEYVPFEQGLRGIIKFFDLPMSNFLAGEMDQPLIIAKNVPLGVFICYEIAYGRVLAHDMPMAELLVTISDDAWFGNSLAPWQHLEIGQFQAAATGRPMLFVGNNGVTAIIDHEGRVIKAIPQFMPEVLTGRVRPYFGATPWIVLGDWPWLILMLLVLLLGYRQQCAIKNAILRD